MAHKYRGMPKLLSLFTDQYLIEEIQDLGYEVYGENHHEFPEWVSSRHFADTGEKMGFMEKRPSTTPAVVAEPGVRSLASAQDGMSSTTTAAAVVVGVAEPGVRNLLANNAQDGLSSRSAEELPPHHQQQEPPRSSGGRHKRKNNPTETTAKWIIKNLGHATGQSRLTAFEKNILKQCWAQFASKKRKRSKQFGAIDFASLCEYWNSCLVERSGVSRKTMKQLKDAFADQQREQNQKSTMNPVRQKDRELCRDLRKGVSPNTVLGSDLQSIFAVPNPNLLTALASCRFIIQHHQAPHQLLWVVYRQAAL